MRGPGENMTILATAYSYSALGHMDYSMECIGFITTLQRGAEWAATGNVTQSVPEEFPTRKKTSAIQWTYTLDK